jgi:hypothetical protein
MNPDDLQELTELLDQIRSMKLHASRRLGAALKKPLLLLLLVSRIENNRVEENRFHFDSRTWRAADQERAKTRAAV